MPNESSLKPRKQPRQARSRATVEAILQAAAQVFCQYGYGEGTTDRVAEKAGVSIGSLYQYFPNKDALLVALAREHMEEGFNIIQGVLAKELTEPSELREMLARFVEALLELHMRAPALHRVLFNEAPLPADFLKEKETREHGFAQKLVGLLSLYPEVTIRDATVASYLLVQVTEGVIHSFIIFPPEGIEAKKVTDEMVEMLYRYLTSSAF